MDENNTSMQDESPNASRQANDGARLDDAIGPYDKGERDRNRPGFSALLVPHRSLSPKGFLIFMSILSAISFAAGMVFVLMGAWPVMGFFGLDVLVVYIAFKLNYRSARMFETVDLSHDNLNITRVHPSGRKESFDFNPYWVRVNLTEQVDGRTSLSLYLHERMVTFGAFLSDDERRDFAGALKNALRDARG